MSHTRPIISALLAGVFASGLSGCFLEDGSGQVTTLYITPSLGQVKNAAVLVKAGDTPATAVTVGMGDTGDSGTAAVDVRGDGPFIIEVIGDDDATYYDEVQGTRSLPTGIVVHALVPAGRTAAGVTPLTDAAWQFLAQSGKPLSAGNVTAANEAVRAALAPGLLDILSVPVPWTALPTNDTLGSSQADVHAVLLGAMVRMSIYGAEFSPALALLQDLQADIAADGQLDAAGGTSVIVYTSRDALQSAVASSFASNGALWLDNLVEPVVLPLFEVADFSYTAPVFSDTP